MFLHDAYHSTDHPNTRPIWKTIVFHNYLRRSPGASVVITRHPASSKIKLAVARQVPDAPSSVGQHLDSTDDAYVQTDSTTVAQKVSRYIHGVLVGNNKPVKAGQALRGSTNAISKWHSARPEPTLPRHYLPSPQTHSE
jgi:hypothetical protein